MKLPNIPGIMNFMAETGTATLKKLGERSSYAEIRQYLIEVDAALFKLKSLPEEDPPTYIFCPSLDYPQTSAKDWAFAYKLHKTVSERERYLYFGDIFKLIDEIQAKMIADGEKLIRKNPDSEAAKKIAELVSVEKDFFTLTNLYATKETITVGQEERLAQYREDMREEISRRLLLFAERATEIARELGEDIEIHQELTQEVSENIGEEKEREKEKYTRGSHVTQEESPSGGEENQTTETEKPRQELIRNEFENIRSLTLETERLTNFYLIQFGEFSSIPPGMFDEAFKNAVRSSINQAILEKLGLSGVQELYANPSLRIAIINDLHKYLNRNRAFIQELNRVIEKRYQALQQAKDIEGIKAFQEKLVEARDPETFALFRVGLANHPDFQIQTEFQFSTDPKNELLRVCETLPYFDQSRLEFEVDQIVEIVDALVARGVPPTLLDHLSTNRFNLLFGTSFTPEQFVDFKDVLAAYWYLHRHDLKQEELQIDWRSRGTSAQELASVSTMSDKDFTAHFVAPTHSSIGNARANGTRAEAHIYAVGTAVGDDSKVDQRKDANYVRKLKEEFYQKQFWQDLSENRKVALLREKQYQDHDIQRIIEAGEMPVDFSMADLADLENDLAFYGDDYYDDDSYDAGGDQVDWDEWDDWDESASPFEQIEIGSSPQASRARQKISAGSPVNQVTQSDDTAARAKKRHAKQKRMKRTGGADKTGGAGKAGGAGKTAKKAASTAKKATKKTKEKAEKQVDKALAGAAATAADAAVPGLGTAMRALPPGMQEFIGKTMRYIGAGLAAVGALLTALTTALWSSIIIPAATVIGGVLGGIVGFAVGGPVGAAVGAAAGAAIGAGASEAVRASTTAGTSPAASAGGANALNTSSGTSSATAASTATSTSTASATTTAGTAFNPATLSVGATAGGAAVFTTITTMLIGSSLLADFPPGSAYTDDPNVKLSYYADIQKDISTGCPDNKCPEISSGSIEVTYTITIKPKGEDTCITITEINDIIKTRYSEKTYKELNKPVPTKPDRVKTIADFPEVLGSDPNDPRNTICWGEVMEFEYTETFDKSYNHALITNTFEAKFYWKNNSGEGNDSVMTGKSFCIGECAMETGCWPATGPVTQAPFSPNWSHAKMDAFDIGGGGVIGKPLYAIFPGELCPGNSDPGYGNHVILTAAEGTFLYGHLSEVHLSGGCKHVEAGETVGLMGNTGNSTGPHLHFEAAHNGGWFRATKPSVLHHEGDPNQGILPPSDNGTKPILPSDDGKGLHVTSCYDAQ